MKLILLNSKAFTILVLTILCLTRTYAQITNDAISDIVNAGQALEVRDESYRENSNEFIKILNCELVDLSEKTYDITWSKLLKVKTVLRNEKLIAKSVKKNMLIPSIDYRFRSAGTITASDVLGAYGLKTNSQQNTKSQEIEEKIDKGTFSYDRNLLNLSEITWITQEIAWEKSVNRVGYSIAYSTGQINKNALILKLNDNWLLFNLSDTLQTNKEIVKMEYEAIQYRTRRNAFIKQLNKDYSSDLTRFFKDTSIYIFEIPRGMISYNGIPAQPFTDGIEFVTYQITNDSLWFLNTFQTDTSKDLGGTATVTYAKTPFCIGKVKLQDVYASGGIDLSKMKGSELYTLNSWSDLMRQAKEYPEKYAKFMNVIDIEQEKWIKKLKENSTQTGNIKYTEYQMLYKHLPLSDWSRYRLLKLIDLNSNYTKTLRFSSFDSNFKYRAVDFEPNPNKLDSNEFIFNEKNYNRRFDSFVPFKTEPAVNEFLKQSNRSDGLTVSDTTNAQKLIALFTFQRLLEVANYRAAAEELEKERKEQEAEESKTIAAMNAKYGEKYVKAAMNMEIIVGMHEDLVNGIVNTLYTVGSTSSSSSGKYYRLDPRYGTGWVSVWIKNKKVSAVTYH